MPQPHLHDSVRGARCQQKLERTRNKPIGECDMSNAKDSNGLRENSKYCYVVKCYNTRSLKPAPPRTLNDRSSRSNVCDTSRTKLPKSTIRLNFQARAHIQLMVSDICEIGRCEAERRAGVVRFHRFGWLRLRCAGILRKRTAAFQFLSAAEVAGHSVAAAETAAQFLSVRLLTCSPFSGRLHSRVLVAPPIPYVAS